MKKPATIVKWAYCCSTSCSRSNVLSNGHPTTHRAVANCGHAPAQAPAHAAHSSLPVQGTLPLRPAITGSPGVLSLRGLPLKQRIAVFDDMLAYSAQNYMQLLSLTSADLPVRTQPDAQPASQVIAAPAPTAQVTESTQRIPVLVRFSARMDSGDLGALALYDGVLGTGRCIHRPGVAHQTFPDGRRVPNKCKVTCVDLLEHLFTGLEKDAVLEALRLTVDIWDCARGCKYGAVIGGLSLMVYCYPELVDDMRRNLLVAALREITPLSPFKAAQKAAKNDKQAIERHMAESYRATYNKFCVPQSRNALTADAED